MCAQCVMCCRRNQHPAAIADFVGQCCNIGAVRVKCAHNTTGFLLEFQGEFFQICYTHDDDDDDDDDDDRDEDNDNDDDDDYCYCY